MKRSVVVGILAVVVGMLSPQLWAEESSTLTTETRVRLRTIRLPSNAKGERVPDGNVLYRGEHFIVYTPTGAEEPTAITRKGKKLTGWLLARDSDSLTVRVDDRAYTGSVHRAHGG